MVETYDLLKKLISGSNFLFFGLGNVGFTKAKKYDRFYLGSVCGRGSVVRVERSNTEL